MMLFFNTADNTYLNGEYIQRDISEKKEITFLFIARFDKNKGMFKAIEIFNKVQNKFQNKKFKLILAGDGPEYNRILEYIDYHQIKNIELPGFIRGNVKHQLFLDSDILLFPSHYGEGMPLSILEGMTYGLPVISSNAGGIPDLITNWENGFSIAIDSLNELEEYKNAIGRLIETPDLYKNISSRNQDFALKHLSPEKARVKLIDFLHSF